MRRVEGCEPLDDASLYCIKTLHCYETGNGALSLLLPVTCRAVSFQQTMWAMAASTVSHRRDHKSRIIFVYHCDTYSCLSGKFSETNILTTRTCLCPLYVFPKLNKASGTRRLLLWETYLYRVFVPPSTNFGDESRYFAAMGMFLSLATATTIYLMRKRRMMTSFTDASTKCKSLIIPHRSKARVNV